MFRSLRLRLILSHVLPLAIITPLLGIALIYAIETEVLLPNSTRDLTNLGQVLAGFAASDPSVLKSPAQAEAFLAPIRPQITSQVMLLDERGYMLAATEFDSQALVGTRPDFPNVPDALSGQVRSRILDSPQSTAELVAVVVPIVDAQGRVIGVVRLTRPLGSLYGQLLHLRYLTAGILLVGMVLGTGVGSLLALNLALPLHRVTRAVHQLTSGERLDRLPEQGPEEIRQLFQAVNSLVVQLRALEQNRQRLLANLVHELGRPLGALRSAIQALQGGADEDPDFRRDLLKGMETEVQGLRRLLDDLARLYDQTIGSLELALQPVDLATWLPQMLSPWRQSAQEKGLNWQTALAADLPTVVADPDRLAQATGNLVSNAIKYTPPGGEVMVSAGHEGVHAWIRIADSGPGITPEERERVLEPFYRGSQGRRFPVGMGLGLSITREIVAALGGWLDIESAQGTGSRFTIWLPLQPGTTLACSPDAAESVSHQAA